MPYRATFEGGPLEGPEHERTIAAPYAPRRLAFMRRGAAGLPADVAAIGRPADAWLLVGTDDAGFLEAPPGELEEYRLDADRSELELEHGAMQGHAVYVHQGPA